VYLEVAKKNGKTLLAGGVGICSRSSTTSPAPRSTRSRRSATRRSSSWNDAAARRQEPRARFADPVEFALSLVQEDTASFFRPLGRDSGESDQGINAHGAIVDELHVIDDRDSIDNIETAMSARRQPMMWKITTAGVKRESVWAEERADALSVVEGRATDDAMLVLIYTLDEGDDPFDEAVWPKANPNLGVSVKVDTLREQAAVAQRSPGKLAAFLRFRMNVPTGVSTRAVDIDEWDANADRRSSRTAPSCSPGSTSRRSAT
jgi:phage terminase large subunit-like protein